MTANGDDGEGRHEHGCGRSCESLVTSSQHPPPPLPLRLVFRTSRLYLSSPLAPLPLIALRSHRSYRSYRPSPLALIAPRPYRPSQSSFLAVIALSVDSPPPHLRPV